VVGLRRIVWGNILQAVKVAGSISFESQCTPKWPNSEPHGATRHQATAMTPAEWSAYQILCVTVVFVILVFKD
jgi:hypothetical protein